MKLFNFIKNLRKVVFKLSNVNFSVLLEQQNIDLTYEYAVSRLKENILFRTEMGVTGFKYGDSQIIVSLTSHGKRVHEVCLTIESLMEQTLKPNKIILWLSKDEFSHSNIPNTLLLLEKRGLTVEFCEDKRSYTKLVPALKKYPDDVIITVDDDIIYPYDLLDRLVKSYLNNPDLIYYCRGHKMKIDYKGQFSSYNDWDFCNESMEVDKLNFPTGVGGVLYPPLSLHPDVVKSDIFLEICPMADDVWFKAMALLNGTKSKKVFTHHADGVDYMDIHNEAQQGTALWNINVSKNDEQIKAVFSRYNLYDLFE